jgi:endonuclease YncB( thermonuclease family)
MISLKKVTSLSLIVCLLLCALTGCVTSEPGVTTTAPAIDVVDYATAVKLEMGSATLKQEATVKTFVDGDTVHFHVPESVMPGGVLKARFLAVNTPESTGKIEEYGKAASKFTREKLELPDVFPDNTDGMLTLVPGQYDTDGFFICRMRRNG